MTENSVLKNNQNIISNKYIVMDIVFFGNSLNYDQGAGNYQELKKITKWDGKQYVLVSRYALRYSILHWANKLFPDEWKLAGEDVLKAEKKEVARLKNKNEAKMDNYKNYSEFIRDIFSNYPEFDLFGFMSASKTQDREETSSTRTSMSASKTQDREGTSLTRTSPVKISHAISLTPYNYDSQFIANLDIMRRASGPGAGSNPVNIEEKKDFYVYNIVIDVNRVGKYLKEEHGDKDIGDIDVSDKRHHRIKELIETIFTLKREIKGRMEDLSPWFVICGLYNNGKYETYIDKIELARHHTYKIITKEKVTKDKEDKTVKEIEHEIIEKNAPKFIIDIDINSYIVNSNKKYKIVSTKDKILEEIDEFLKGNVTDYEILVYKRSFIQTEPSFEN